MANPAMLGFARKPLLRAAGVWAENDLEAADIACRAGMTALLGGMKIVFRASFHTRRSLLVQIPLPVRTLGIQAVSYAVQQVTRSLSSRGACVRLDDIVFSSLSPQDVTLINSAEGTAAAGENAGARAPARDSEPPDWKVVFVLRDAHEEPSRFERTIGEPSRSLLMRYSDLRNVDRTTCNIIAQLHELWLDGGGCLRDRTTIVVERSEKLVLKLGQWTSFSYQFFRDGLRSVPGADRRVRDAALRPGFVDLLITKTPARSIFRVNELDRTVLARRGENDAPDDSDSDADAEVGRPSPRKRPRFSSDLSAAAAAAPAPVRWPIRASAVDPDVDVEH